MNEVFQSSRASLAIHGVYPLRITASSQTGSDEVTATSIILSKLPNGQSSVMHKSLCISGKRCDPLPEYDWTSVLAQEVAEMVTNEWFGAVLATKEPIWNEYLRVKGPLTWIEQENPGSEILRYMLRAEDSLLDTLSGLAHNMQQPLASKALRQAVELRLKVRLRNP